MLERDTTGQNSLDVVTTDPAVSVSLVLPSGAEVTAAIAPAYGIAFTIVPNGAFSNVEIPSVLSLPGTHTLFQIQVALPSGSYQIKANASSANSSSGILATYFSSSTVGVTATTDAANYKVGDTVVISGLAFDGATPVTGATVTASVSTPINIAASSVLGNFQLVGQQAVNASLTDYSYSATLRNTSTAVQSVRAQAQTASLPAGIAVLNDTLVFGDISANTSATSLNTITIERNPNQPFDPATLPWNVTTPGTPVNVTRQTQGPSMPPPETEFILAHSRPQRPVLTRPCCQLREHRLPATAFRGRRPRSFKSPSRWPALCLSRIRSNPRG